MSRPIKIKILDHEYLVRSDEDEAQVQEIAQYVNSRFVEVEKSAEGLSERKKAILAAFQIASEYFRLLKERDELVGNYQRRAQDLVRQIDSLRS
jgi:cell division protein ZapA